MRSNGIIAKILSWMDEHHLLVIIPVIGIIASIGVFVWSENRSLPEPEPISRDAQPGDYCSMDIQVLSRWILKISGEEEQSFYLAVDTSDEYYIVSMNDTQFGDFAEIVDFTYAEAPTYVPEARQAAGLVYAMTEDNISTLADALELTEEEYLEMVGSNYLNMKHTPNTNIVGTFIWVLAASLIFLALKGLSLFEEWNENRKQKKSRKSSYDPDIY